MPPAASPSAPVGGAAAPPGAHEPDASDARDALVVQRQATIVSLTTVVTSIANYGFSLLAIHLLAPGDYVRYASVQGLLLLLGSGGMAAIPWAVARHVALAPGRRGAGEALGFGLRASAVQGVAFAVVAFAVVAPVSGLVLGGTTAAAAFSLSLVAAPLGVLQGQQRLVRISVLRLVETAVRLGLALALLLLVAADPVSPVIGFAVGSAVLLALGLVACRGAFPLARASAAVSRALLRRSASLGAVQLCLVSLGVIDTVVITLVGLQEGPASAYQIAALLGRVPLFLSTAVALAYFQSLARADTQREVDLQLARAVRLLVVLAVPVAVLVATCPPVLLGPLTGGRPEEVARLLPATASIGLTVATVTVLATTYQARETYRRFFLVLAPLVLLQPVAILAAGRVAGVDGFAAAGVVVGVAALALVLVDQRGRRPWAALRRGEALGLGVVGVLGALSLVQPWVWPAAVVAAALVVLPALGLSASSLRPSSAAR